MRRFRLMIALLASVILLAGLIPTGASAEAISSAGLPRAVITIDGNRLNAEAVNVNGRILAPVRAIFEALGAEVAWEAATRTAIGTKGNLVIRITIDQDVAYVGDKAVPLAVPALLVDSRTFVPVRFIGEALGADVKWDGPNQTVVITFNAGCTLAGGQQHEGTIADTGETWGLCGSPHIVAGEFLVEGKSSPVLTIEAGAMVRFAEGASISVGYSAPGGLMVTGTASNPVTMTADMLNPQPGYWQGLRFYGQTIRDKSELDYTKIQYAGTNNWMDGAVWLNGGDRPIEVTLNNVTISNSLQTGLKLIGQARLSSRSTKLSINGTVAANEEGGFPIVTSVYGSNGLPAGGTFEKNALNAVEIDTSNTGVVSSNTTWKNIGIPYAVKGDIEVGGTQSPVLTIEPGVTTLWQQDYGLWIGYNGPGSLKADASARPEGGGEWRSVTPEDLTNLTANSIGQLASSSRMSPEPGCALCGSSVITFGSWSAEPTRGSWDGIIFHNQAGVKNVLNGVVVAYGGGNTSSGEDRLANVVLDTAEKAVSVTLKNSLLTNSAGYGLFVGDKGTLNADSTGNIATGNLAPMRLSPDAVAQPGSWNGLTGNDHDWISVWGGDDMITKSGTWKNLAVPYLVEGYLYLRGSDPVLTIEPGSTLMFKSGAGMEVSNGAIVAKGQAAKPIKFTGQNKRAGYWYGLHLTEEASDGNAFEYVTVEYARKGFDLDADFGNIIKNTTIRSSSEMGIYRGWGTEGTDFLTGFGNQFEGNAEDMNVE